MVDYHRIRHHLPMQSGLRDVGPCARSGLHTANTILPRPIYPKHYYGLCNSFDSAANSMETSNACSKEGLPRGDLCGWLFVCLDLLVQPLIANSGAFQRSYHIYCSYHLFH